MSTTSYNGRSVRVSTVTEVAQRRVFEIRQEACRRAAALVPGGVWTSGLSVVLVALSGQSIGTMTVERANQIIAKASAVWSALLEAEAEIEAVMSNETMSEEQKVAAIDAIWPSWPSVEDE
jgi:hypothetical protein